MQACLGAHVVEGAAGWTISTPAERWSYAAIIPFPRDVVANDARSLGVVRAVVDVHDGRIGFGGVEDDGSTYLVEEEIGSVTAAEPAAPATVEFLVEDCDRCAYVVFRNVRPDDRPSSCVVRSIDVRFMHDPGESVLERPLPLRPIEAWSNYYGDHVDGVDQALRSRAYDRLTAPRAIPWIESLRVWLHPGNATSRVVAASGLYEPGILLLLKRLLAPGGVFVDVGANAGLLSLFGARCVRPGGAVHAFEPSAREYACLCDNVALNNLTDEIFTVHSALGEDSEPRFLRIADWLNSGMNTFGDRYATDSVTTMEVQEVKVSTLDAYAAGAGLSRVDVIKVDTEGSEVRVLRGARGTLARFRPALILEVSPRLLAACGSSVTELDDVVVEHDYALHAVDEGTGAVRSIPTLAEAGSGYVLALPPEAGFSAAVDS